MIFPSFEVENDTTSVMRRIIIQFYHPFSLWFNFIDFPLLAWCIKESEKKRIIPLNMLMHVNDFFTRFDAFVSLIWLKMLRLIITSLQKLSRCRNFHASMNLWFIYLQSLASNHWVSFFCRTSKIRNNGLIASGKLNFRLVLLVVPLFVSFFKPFIQILFFKFPFTQFRFSKLKLKRIEQNYLVAIKIKSLKGLRN